jgi:hypothetical protein
MADWRKVSMAVLLADGKINNSDIKVLKKELYANKKISHGEVLFLVELRNQAMRKAGTKNARMNPAYEKFFFKAVEDCTLRNGRIDAAEVRFLREMLFANSKVDSGEWKFMQMLNRKAKHKSTDFTKLYQQCEAKMARNKTRSKAKRSMARSR